jgi:hypothetical protein
MEWWKLIKEVKVPPRDVIPMQKEADIGYFERFRVHREDAKLYQ